MRAALGYYVANDANICSIKEFWVEFGESSVAGGAKKMAVSTIVIDLLWVDFERAFLVVHE